MEKALSLAYRYLAFRPRTISEVRTYLHKKRKQYSYSDEEIQASIELLKDQGYLDDMAFIKSFVRSRAALKPKSRRVLELELQKLGVSPRDSQSFFELNPLNEESLAYAALRKKIKTFMHTTDEKKRFSKAISFLLRRGFSFDVAKKAYLQVVHT